MIEIPGYRVIRALGRGGMASVFLAVQESVQREVAIKILAPTLMGDPSFGERFLREARIAAKLRHPHVVQVHDVGVAGACHYIAMEYLSGGPVLRRDQPPRGLRFALRVCREIASALGYAHARGVIHRDIKPDNILLREDGAAVLTDFGIARASDNVRMTMTGSIMGTPSYMSPEQARGVELDGRSDLYSLGVVFYELLTGDVPYSATDSLSVGIMHITQPVPQLPAELSWLQPVINRCLAKDAPARFQTGDDLAQALAEIEQGLTPTPIRSMASTVSPPSKPIPLATPMEQAAEPSMGRVDPSLINSRVRPRGKDRGDARSGFGWIGWVVAALVLAASIGWHFQEDLRALWPQSRTQELLVQAQQALQDGRLERTGAQPGARELFETVQNFDPDNAAARQGLADVGERWLEQAQLLAASGDLAGARLALQNARAVGVAGSRIEIIESRFVEDSKLEETLGKWLEQAASARQAGQLFEGENSALKLYQRVLEVDGQNAVATSGLNEVLSSMSATVRELVRLGEMADAEQRLALMAAAVPAHPDIPALQAELAAAQQSGKQSVEKALAAAAEHLRRGRLTQPAGGNALDAYRAILREHPGQVEAEAGIRKVQQALMGQFGKLLSDFETGRAEAVLAAAEDAGLRASDVRAARERLADAARRQTAMQSNLDAARDPARIRRLLDEAQAAMQAGQLMAPPGDSAYDKYRQVQSADPQNAEARAGMAQIPLEARRRFDESMRGGKLKEARGFLEALEGLPSPDPAIPGLKSMLARAYIGFANERLGANEAERARGAFETARELDPTNPDLVSLQARLEQLSGSR